MKFNYYYFTVFFCIFCISCGGSKPKNDACVPLQILLSPSSFSTKVENHGILSPAIPDAFESHNPESAETDYFLSGVGASVYIASQKINYWSSESVAKQQFIKERNDFLKFNNDNLLIPIPDEISNYNYISDEHTVRCFEVLTQNGSRKECRFVSRYGGYVSQFKIRIDMEDFGINMNEIEMLLQKIDVSFQPCWPI